MGAAMSRPWGEGETYRTTTDEIMRDAKDGDVLLFQGDGNAAGMIRWLSASTRWSHVAIVVEHPDTGKKMATEVYGEIIGCDVIRGDRHKGVQFIDLRERLENYPSHRVAWRPLKGGKVDKQKTRDLIEWYRDLKKEDIPQYNFNIFDFVQYGSRNETDNNVRFGTKYYVCTAWAAEVLMTLGIILSDPSKKGSNDNGPRAGMYALVDFGLTYYIMPTLKDPYYYQEIYYQVNLDMGKPINL